MRTLNRVRGTEKKTKFAGDTVTRRGEAKQDQEGKGKQNSKYNEAEREKIYREKRERDNNTEKWIGRGQREREVGEEGARQSNEGAHCVYVGVIVRGIYTA